MNTRSRINRSESGIGESECPQQASQLHRIFEESPSSPSVAATVASTNKGIPTGRSLERSPARSPMGPPPPPTYGHAIGRPAEQEMQEELRTPRHRPSTHRDESTIRRPSSPALSEHTIRSHRSSVGTAARVRQVEYEAEKELIELEDKRIKMKQSLIKKRLEAEISAIEAEEDGSNIGDEQRVREWIDRSQADHSKGQQQRTRATEVLHPVTEVRGEDRPRQRGIDRLANTIERMIDTRPPPRQTSELPPFNGSVMEWLPFKAAMEDSTRLYRFSATENLLRLRNSLRGEARETVLSQLYTATSPDLVMRTLEMKYGRPEYIIDKAIEDLKRLPRVGNSSSELNEVAIKLQNIVCTMKSVDRRGYLQNPLLIRDVMDKLSPHIISKWAEYAIANEERIASDSEIAILAEFLMIEADRVLRYTHTARHSAPGPPKEGRPIRRTAPREKVFSTSESTSEEQAPCCLRCQSTSHHTPQCPKLREMTLNERWNWAKEQRLCFKCMARKHNRITCKAKLCGVDGCKMQHHAILHKTKEASQNQERSSECADTGAPAAVMNVTSKTAPGTVLLKTCKVKLSGPRGEVITDALLDEGSTVTLIEEDLAKMIAKEGQRKPLNIKGINEDRRVHSGIVQLQVRGLHEQKAHSIKARTIKGLQLHQQRIPEDLERYPHLRDITHVSYEEARPRILIGADNWHLIVSRQLRVGKCNEPAASWTKLGWVIHGSVPRRVLMEDEEAVLHIYTQPSDLRLEKLVESHFDVDSLGITTKYRVSERDQRAERIIQDTMRRKGKQFEVGLPWKTDNPELPDSYEQALKRLETLEKKMKKEPSFKKEYTAQINNLLEKRYAETCDGSEQNSNVKWYLPHFAVVNINKPDRTRMVFDAAARAHGISLNDCLLEGPDLLASLTKILFGFREKRIAVTADIQEMFLRIKIRREDQPAQMFLWRSEASEVPRQYKMTSMIFGASSSPYLAHSVRNKNAADYEKEYPAAARAIKERHYMDDYLDSFESEEEAIQIIKEIIYIHEQASFNLRGWNSNSPAVLATVPEDKRSKNGDVQLAAPQLEKTLGLRWNPRSDTVGFNTDTKRVPPEVRNWERAPTKREALSLVMSIYDPLGLISNYTITGKIVLQQLWAKKIGWDEELPQEEAEVFRQWATELTGIAALTLPRCYSYDVKPGSELQLHVFNDASEQAYSTTAYWRITHEDGTVEVILVMGKAKVAPLKLLTIPRLELQAALIDARIASTVLKEHTWKPTKVYYWTDSKTVLHWIRNDVKKYTPFVAHRLAEIAELTQKEDWRWVPTSENVADDATRTSTRRVTREDRWFNGPSFLRNQEEMWPSEEPEHVTTEEVVYSVVVENKLQITAYLPDIKRFSSFTRLMRVTARVKLFVEKLKRKNRSLQLEITHLRWAKLQWIRKSQEDSFGEELKRIRAGQPLHRQSKIRKLDPALDDEILKARGRIAAVDIATQSNQPIVLDGRHPYTVMLIMEHHRRAGHANNERIVNELRQEYIITHLRPTVKKVARQCQLCRIRRAAPHAPPRGDLPKGRLNPGHRPFYSCGVDYFGPLNITIGRRHEKRWCALFTCLTTRAIHLELVASLSTDSAIMALRRMAARRGWPKIMYSDNATNFKGADTELRSAYKRWGPELRDFGLQHDLEWRFIPPGAPHMGGAWERLVRSVKAALSTTLHEKAPKEEILQTLLTEAEYSVNARPLTHVSVDPLDDEALTPNHFLIGSSIGLPLTGTCNEADRSTWRKTQALADQFWNRWLKEYLPTLIPRGQESISARPLQVGDLVIVVDNVLPRNTWPRGIVERVYPGQDGVVRSADVRTKGGVFRRPAVKLAVLQVGEAATELRRGENVTDG